MYRFGTVLYHIKGDPAESTSIIKPNIEPIMFLSKGISAAELKYWPTELEVADIVWTICKVRHLVNSRKYASIVYTDHASAIAVFLQINLNTSNTDKLNLRLIKTSQYLLRFNLDFWYKKGKVNIVPDVLLRLLHAKAAESITDILKDIPVYHTMLVSMSDDFKNRLKQAYSSDPHWAAIIKSISRRSQGETSKDEIKFFE